MPTYDYRCLKCEHEFELMQKMSDDPVSVCPECSGKVKRLIGTGAGIIFKGSGFYETDYRSDNYKKQAEAESSKAKGDKSSDSGKSTKAKSGSDGTAKAS